MWIRKNSKLVTAAVVSTSVMVACAQEGSSEPVDDNGNLGTSGATSSGGVPGLPGASGGTANGPGGSGGSTGNPGGAPQGSGGAPGSGGDGSAPPPGTGGNTTPAPTTVTISPENLIDDLEDGDGSITAQGGRVGAWYTYNDETAAGSQTPMMGATFEPVDGGNASAKAAHTSGTGFSTWGAGFGFDLNNDGTTKLLYDASAFTGIAFAAKGTPFRLKVLTSATTPVAEGGTCTATKCGDSFGKAIEATSSYQQFVVPFASLVQEKWGEPAEWDAATVIGVQFQLGADITFDISIDDVGFY